VLYIVIVSKHECRYAILKLLSEIECTVQRHYILSSTDVFLYPLPGSCVISGVHCMKVSCQLRSSVAHRTWSPVCTVVVGVGGGLVVHLEGMLVAL